MPDKIIFHFDQMPAGGCSDDGRLAYIEVIDSSTGAELVLAFPPSSLLPFTARMAEAFDIALEARHKNGATAPLGDLQSFRLYDGDDSPRLTLHIDGSQKSVDIGLSRADAVRLADTIYEMIGPRSSKAETQSG